MIALSLPVPESTRYSITAQTLTLTSISHSQLLNIKYQPNNMLQPMVIAIQSRDFLMTGARVAPHPLRHVINIYLQILTLHYLHPQKNTTKMPYYACTPTKQARIVQMRAANVTYGNIADELGISESTARRNWAKFHGTQDWYRKPYRPGRRRKLDDEDLKRVEEGFDNGDLRDGEDCRRQLFPHIDSSTMRKNLRRIGLKGRIRREKPILRQENITKRQEWAQKHKNWKVDDWKKVWFSNESKFNLFGSDGRQYCRRRDGEALEDRNVKKTVKHGGGSLMVWGCISWNGTGRLVRVHGKMDRYQYCDILEEGLLRTLHDRGLRSSDIIFQQDNDPKHTAGYTMNWFKKYGISVLSWISQSPDMNIIGHAWDQLDIQLRSRPLLPKNLDKLWDALVEEWGNLDLEKVRDLYRSCPRRVAALDKSKGWHTKY